MKGKKLGGGKAVFVMPILPNFYASHQWVRELRRRSHAPLLAVDFRIDDRELVLVGHYYSQKVAMPAAEAARLIMRAADPQGYEVIILKDVPATAVIRTRAVP